MISLFQTKRCRRSSSRQARTISSPLNRGGPDRGAAAAALPPTRRGSARSTPPGRAGAGRSSRPGLPPRGSISSKSHSGTPASSAAQRRRSGPDTSRLGCGRSGSAPPRRRPPAGRCGSTPPAPPPSRWLPWSRRAPRRGRAKALIRPRPRRRPARGVGEVGALALEPGLDRDRVATVLPEPAHHAAR